MSSIDFIMTPVMTKQKKTKRIIVKETKKVNEYKSARKQHKAEIKKLKADIKNIKNNIKLHKLMIKQTKTAEKIEKKYNKKTIGRI